MKKPAIRKAARTPRLITLDEAAIALQWLESTAFGSPVVNDRKQARTVIGLIRGLERFLDKGVA